MFYYAILNSKGVCCDVSQYETEQTTNSLVVEIDSYDTSLIYRKKYIAETQEWVDCLPSETGLPMSDRLGYSPTDEWLSDVLGNTENLSTTNKTSLVSAINEVFQSASDSKTAIANAITGVNSSVTIPENPTFAQLASLISQLSAGDVQIAIGSIEVLTIPSAIEGSTSFRPKIVIIYNFGSGLSNFNMGVYVSPTVTGVTTQQISDSANGIGGTLSRRANAFTVTDNGFSMINSGAATNLKWIAIGLS